VKGGAGLKKSGSGLRLALDKGEVIED